MYNHKEIEDWAEKFWEEHQIYNKVKNRGEKYFEFIDGPPFVTGEIHPGTAWNKSIKDAILRFYRMRGYKVNDTPGYDTHGLPIEVKVEKMLNIENKGEIENKIGIEKFIKECKEFAENYRKIMTEQLKKFHVWMDWDNPYITFKREYIERSWKTIKKAWEKGLLREGDYVVPYCYRCQTTLANYELEYKNLKDPSIYVKFPTNTPNLYFLIWTTTPWTLVANLAVMVNPNEVYIEISKNNERLIIAKKRYNDIFKDWKIEREFLGRELEGVEYVHPFDDLIDYKFNRKVVLSEEFVSMEDGTGLVHSAPGHGEEDFKVGLKYNLPTFSFVDDAGRYIEAAGVFKGKIARETNNEIISLLEQRGLLFKKETIEHSYPTCWRCKSPLIYRSTHQWFITITDFKDKMIEQAKQVKWIPEFAMKRFINFLQNSPDWCISRQRYWGIPLPIWKCDKCGEIKVLDKIPPEIEDPHRPYIDNYRIKCETCGGEMSRIPDVLDVWFDSGNAVWASTGRDSVADFIVEGQDQIRGWFYSLLGSGMIYYDKIPYKAVAMHGFFVDEKGEKMSKSLGNYIPVEQILEKVGADTFRMFGLSNNIWEDLKFNWRDLENTKKEIFILLNIIKYLEENYSFKEPEELELWDKWILAKLAWLKKLYITSFENFEYYIAVRALREFLVEDVSKFYMKLVKSNPPSINVLYKVMDQVLLMLAPIIPATAEYIYQHFFRKYQNYESIFMKSIEPSEYQDMHIIEDMEKVRRVISNILDWRQKNNISLRMPLKTIYIQGVEGYEKIIGIITNTKQVISKTPERIDLDLKDVKVQIEVSKEEFLDEWLFNEISRRIQYYRKLKGIKKDETITLYYSGSDKVLEIIDKYKQELEQKIRAKLINDNNIEGYKFDIKDNYLILKMA